LSPQFMFSVGMFTGGGVAAASGIEIEGSDGVVPPPVVPPPGEGMLPPGLPLPDALLPDLTVGDPQAKAPSSDSTPAVETRTERMGYCIWFLLEQKGRGFCFPGPGRGCRPKNGYRLFFSDPGRFEPSPELEFIFERSAGALITPRFRRFARNQRLSPS
jgi:hypothetical protein